MGSLGEKSCLNCCHFISCEECEVKDCPFRDDEEAEGCCKLSGPVSLISMEKEELEICWWINSEDFDEDLDEIDEFFEEDFEEN